MVKRILTTVGGLAIILLFILIVLSLWVSDKSDKYLIVNLIVADIIIILFCQIVVRVKK